MEKLKKIVELLNRRGSILIRNAHEYEGGNWYVHCWTGERKPYSKTITITTDVYNGFVLDLESALDEIIKKLEDNNYVK